MIPQFKFSQPSRVIALSISIFVLSAGCKKSNGSPTSDQSATSIQLTMPRPQGSVEADTSVRANGDAQLNSLIERKYPASSAKDLEDTAARLNVQGDAEDKLAALRRRTMVDPPPADFKPEPIARKIRLKLVLEKPAIDRGERPRFRLEMMNVGNKAIDYQENDPSVFVKGASLLDSSVMHFFLTDPAGMTTELIPRQPPRSFQSGGEKAPNEIDGPPPGMSESEKARWFAEINAESAASTNFRVRLLPGETIHSIGDDDSPHENFRTLFTTNHFDKVGPYRLQVRLDDRPSPMSKIYIEASLRSGSTLVELQKDLEQRLKDALGPVSSNTVAFEIVK